MSPTTLALALATLAGLGTASAAAEPAQILTKAGCVACHAPDRKLVGPSYKEIAAKYKGNPAAPALLSDRVRKGSKGIWGPLPMIPNEPAKISDADLKTVVGWILKTPG